MFLLVSFLLTWTATIQVSGWEVFTDTRFKWQWAEELGAKVEIPVFGERIKELEGKEITLTGYYLPLELGGERIIISKYPYASCFFCGGVGPESVAEVVLDFGHASFVGDELITVKGRLKLNENDFESLVFILEDAKIVQS
ncbi:MAG: DUF3299 domain-containing protein [Cyclobacteriaceae bacterium]|nr:DUF3299 domain-containing protein [Cyclobacteriaceae bacterium HetDA_MAG_MS6]